MDYPSDVELALYLASAGVGCTVQRDSENNGDVGKRQSSNSLDAPMLNIRDHSYYTRILLWLQVWEGYVVRTTKRVHPAGGLEVSVRLERDETLISQATGDSHEQAVARAAWLAIEKPRLASP